MPAELSAAAILIGFWNRAINAAAWISICMVVVFVINMLGAGESTGFSCSSCFQRLYKGAYGEAEFWFAYVATHMSSSRCTNISLALSRS